MYGYFCSEDGSKWQPPVWASREALFKPLLSKTPWQSAYDRLMRLLVRYDQRSGDIDGSSYLEDAFDTHSSEEGLLAQDGFEALCKEGGYSRAEVQLHYRGLFEVLQAEAAAKRPSVSMQAAARASSTGEAADGLPAPPPPPFAITFRQFVKLYMQEPAAHLRFKEVPATLNMAVSFGGQEYDLRDEWWWLAGGDHTVCSRMWHSWNSGVYCSVSACPLPSTRRLCLRPPEPSRTSARGRQGRNERYK
jgi:hypothetical protein